MPPVQPGDTAPQFTLLTDEGKSVSLASLGGKPIVLFFYPKDDTPGCTIECKEFRDARAAYLEKAHVFGISPDDMASHQAFRDKYALNFPLLSDPGHEVAEQYGVWGAKPSGNEGIFRTTFILKDGKVARVFESVKPEGHAAEVLAAL
ncbi:MAG: alkyl hydroperoxide reductase/Thiol specific antioxidant/Mal allergen [Fibrobacteres bacterium]|nr:alkyl hydroperoxide reductase/Thiol specific antioxidant/Mal allergen [Fibrobacterota bacterium]